MYTAILLTLLLHCPLLPGETDSVTLHFIHGSVTRPDCPDQRVRLGGKWGGHVEMEIDDMVYAFEVADRVKGVHYFPRRHKAHFNAEFTVKTLAFWQEETRNDKITSFRIPVTPEQKAQLDATYRRRYTDCAYDYAFFGMRCTASAYEMLAGAGVFQKKSHLGYMFRAFYPRKLRNRLHRLAVKRQWTVVYKEGIACREWD